MRMDIAVRAGVMLLMLMLMLMALACEQRTFQTGFVKFATGFGGQAEQPVRLLQLRAGVGYLALVLGAVGRMLEAQQVDRRAAQFDFQDSAFQRRIELSHAMLVAAQAGMFVVVVVVVMLVGMSDDGQQREGQGKQQVAHGGSPLNCSLRYNK